MSEYEEGAVRLEFPERRPEVALPLTPKNIELFRWTVDAKVRALVALCGTLNNGKGADDRVQQVNSLAWEIVNLKLHF